MEGGARNGGGEEEPLVEWRRAKGLLRLVVN